MRPVRCIRIFNICRDTLPLPTLFCNTLGFFKLHGQQFGHPVLPHRYPVELARSGHGRSVVRDDDKLRLRAELLYHIRVATAVGFVERRVGLVQNKKRRGIHLTHRKDKCDRGESALAAGEHVESADFLAGKRDIYREPCIQFLFLGNIHFVIFLANLVAFVAFRAAGLLDFELGVTAAKELREEALQRDVDVLDALCEPRVYRLFQFGDYVFEFLRGSLKVGKFAREEFLALFGLIEFADNGVAAANPRLLYLYFETLYLAVALLLGAPILFEERAFRYL